MTQLFEIKVKLSENQKKNIGDAYRKRETIIIRLTNDSLSGSDTLYVPAMVKKRLEKNRKENKGMDIKLSKTNIRKQVGGSILTSALALGTRICTNYCENFRIGSSSWGSQSRSKSSCQENIRKWTERRFPHSTKQDR